MSSLRSENFLFRNTQPSNWSTSDWPENDLLLTADATSGRGTLKSTLAGTSRKLRRNKTADSASYHGFSIPFIGNAIGKTPFSGIDNSIICSIQLAIYEFTRKSQGEPERDLLIQDFQHYDNTFYPQAGSETTPQHKFPDFRFSVFAPTSFRYFRKTFQILSLDYVNSICSQPLVPLSNPGSSGSILYVTSDDRFILKSVQKREALFLARLLPGYFLNVIQNRQTLLPKFFGMYAYSSRTSKVCFIVMNNLIPSNLGIDVRYDLKGSTHKRYASDFERRKPQPTLKDLDFCEAFNTTESSGIGLLAETREALLNTMEKDCRVLQSFSIMDYSLLLGIHRCRVSGTCGGNWQEPSGAIGYLTSMGSIAQGASPSPNEAAPGNQEVVDEWHGMEQGRDIADNTPYGGIPAYASNGDRLLVFVGIIDILQSYNTRKRLEHLIKSALVSNPSTISVTEPCQYRQRFLKFMKFVVFRTVSPPLPAPPRAEENAHGGDTHVGQHKAMYYIRSLRLDIPPSHSTSDCQSWKKDTRPLHLKHIQSISTSTVDNDSGYPSGSSTTVRTFVRTPRKAHLPVAGSTGGLGATEVLERHGEYATGGHLLLVDSTSL